MERNWLQTFFAFWDTLGWLANLIEILSAAIMVIGLVYAVSRKYRGKNAIRSKFHNIFGYIIDNVGTVEKTSSTLLSSLRLAVVDDNPADFPIDYLKVLVGRVDVFTEVSLAEVSRFADYEVVFLDITGVVKEDLQKGGLSFLKKLRTLENSPLIIAVSSKKFDPTMTEFFKLADDIMRKPVTEIQCEEKLRNLISERLVPHSYAQNLDDILQQAKLPASSRQELVQEIISFLQSATSQAVLAESLKRTLGPISGRQAELLAQQISRVVTVHA